LFTDLKAGGRLEEEIWHEFSDDRENLRKLSQAIINLSPEVPRPTEYEDEEFEEGRVLTKLHKIRERSPSVSKKKKAEVLKKKRESLHVQLVALIFANFMETLAKA
jgi:5-methylcytosine-specific restriction protein A